MLDKYRSKHWLPKICTCSNSQHSNTFILQRTARCCLLFVLIETMSGRLPPISFSFLSSALNSNSPGTGSSNQEPPSRSSTRTVYPEGTVSTELVVQQLRLIAQAVQVGIENIQKGSPSQHGTYVHVFSIISSLNLPIMLAEGSMYKDSKTRTVDSKKLWLKLSKV